MRLRKTFPLIVTAGILTAACAVFEPAAAVVNGKKIEDERFRRAVDFVLADPRFADLAAPEAQIAEQRRDVVREVLTFFIEQEVIRDHAAERGIGVEEEELDALLDQQIQAAGGEGAFRQRLEDSGASITDVRDLVRQQILREKVADDVIREEITEEDLRSVFEERLDDLTTVHAAHILVLDREEAEELAARVTPENFERLAAERSEDEGSAARGGDLGPRPATDFVEPFAEAALAIPVGEIGGPVQTEFGYHIIRVLDRRAPSFEDVRQRLLDERSGEVFLSWLEGRVRESEIRVNPRYGVLDPETGRVIARTATTPVAGSVPQAP